MRAPEWATPTNELYRAAIEMAAFADGIGVDDIGLMEHHGSDDGYLPQPFALAAAMAAVTNNVRFLLGAVLLPLHDPVTVAEQIAITDLISNGRLKVIFGAGYVPFEFAMFGKSLKDRAALMDSGIDTILRALRGERFEADGRPVYVRPLPVQKPEDSSWSVAAWRRRRNERRATVSASGRFCPTWSMSISTNAAASVNRPGCTSGRDPYRSASICVRTPSRAGPRSSGT